MRMQLTLTATAHPTSMHMPAAVHSRTKAYTRRHNGQLTCYPRVGYKSHEFHCFRLVSRRGEGLCFFFGAVLFCFSLFILVESEKRKKRVEKGMVFGEVLLGHLGAVCSLRSMEVLLGL